MAQGSRAVGRIWSSPQANEAPLVNLVLSMTGEGAVTLTVSSALPGSRTRSTATRPPSVTTTPDRAAVLNSASSALRL